MGSTSKLPAVFWVSALLALGLAFWLRSESAVERQFHADEGVQSFQAWRLIETGEYRYDPNEHHGPFLYYLTKWLAPFMVDENGSLTDAGMRRIPIGFSLLSLAAGCVFFSRWGRKEAVIWALLIAASPLCIIYGAYYIQEALLTFFTLGFAYLAYHYVGKPSANVAVGVGFFAACMHVNKETAVIHIAVVLVALAILSLSGRIRKIDAKRFNWRHLLLACSAFALLHVLFFSSFFGNMAGIVDGFAAYFGYVDRAGGQGHEKPFFYYLSLFLPQTLEGVSWGELSFLLLAAAGMVLSLLRKSNPMGDYTSLVGLGLLLAYSIIPYKTPWLALTVVFFIGYPAAVLLVRLYEQTMARRGLVRVCLALALLFAVSWLSWEQSANIRNGIFRYASASRNPYLYVHTTPRYERLLERLESVDADRSIAVRSLDGAWPLPWHLRERAHVGYWMTLDSLGESSIEIIDTRMVPASSDLSFYSFWELHGLRPNVLLVLGAEQTVADEWVKP